MKRSPIPPPSSQQNPPLVSPLVLPNRPPRPSVRKVYGFFVFSYQNGPAEPLGRKKMAVE